MKRKNMKFLLATFFIGIVIVFAACGRTEGVAAVNKAGDGLALRGYDAVAYFAIENAVKGDAKYEYAWNGARWLFSSAENLQKFKLDPAAYAPQYGGYCSYAVSHGYTADGDPEAWKIVDGKLYLNYNEKAKAAWESEQERNIDQGDKNWVEFQVKKPQHKG